MKRLMVLFLVVGLVISGASFALAEALTLDLVKQKVLDAAKLLEAEGDAAIPKIKDEKGAFRFADGEGYIWIHDMDGKMIMHPVKPALDGQNVLSMTDPNGFTLFAAMNDVAENNGQGWVAYKWPKPSQKDASDKVSFVKLVKKDGKSYVVGCGMYDVTVADIKSKFAGDAVYEE